MSFSETAAALIESYGQYPIATTFAATDSVPELPDSEVPAYGAAFDTDPSVKRHAACDECSMTFSHKPFPKADSLSQESAS